MILPKEFNDQWDVSQNGPLIRLNYNDLIEINLSQEVKMFLSTGGLPETPAPYLEFTASKSSLRSVVDECKPSEFQKYWILGSTGSGDSICIVEKQETLVYLNNSNNYEETFINSTINQFAESLIVYSKMIDKAIEVNGEDAYINNDIPESVIEWLKKELARIDAKSLEADSFWYAEIENLLE